MRVERERKALEESFIGKFEAASKTACGVCYGTYERKRVRVILERERKRGRESGISLMESVPCFTSCW